MNRQEKLISLLLGLVLAGWIWHTMSQQKEALAAQRAAALAAATNGLTQVSGAAVTNAAAVAKGGTAVSADKPAETAAATLPKATYAAPEKVVVLSNGVERVELSTHGATVKRITLLDYAVKPGEVSAENPAVALDFAASPAFEIVGAGDFTVTASDAQSVTFSNAKMSRTITLKDGYRLAVNETFASEGAILRGSAMSLGAMTSDGGKNDLLSVDSWCLRNEKGKGTVEHHGETEPLKAYLTAGSYGGCSSAKSAAGIPETSVVTVPGARAWVALKNRFFATALCEATDGNDGFTAAVRRDMSASAFVPQCVSATVAFKPAAGAGARSYVFYAGPKQQDLLWDLGAAKGSWFGTGGLKDVMEYGMWRWVCYPLVWVLRHCHDVIPSYGIAIILLTLLVRLVFWPLTHKSTISMRRMSEIQPLMKEIREKFKDNPQRMQQETFALYREHKVNPMASCLPMLVQIPVFIALFTILRSAVELRFASFLWIADLSEPEGLFASWFPFGGLNILPILMAVSTALQSAFTPTTGDKNQQRMMMVMMPAMMLFMFYSFPSALSLYWFVSNLLSIAQMWYIRKRYPGTAPAKA